MINPNVSLFAKLSRLNHDTDFNIYFTHEKLHYQQVN